MRYDGTSLGFSPTDLAAFSSCPQRTLLDRLKVLGLAEPNVYPDPRLDLLRARGAEHEKRYLEQFRAEGKRVVAFGALAKDERSPEGYAGRAEETLGAMKEGPDVIYQATLFDGEWLGFADFLIRVDGPSDLGDWSYEVVDAKLAREAKGTAILQTCVYSRLLARVQGTEPARIHLYLGGPTPRRASFRLAHFAAYYRSLDRRFEEHVAAAPDEPPVAPDPVDACQVCDWASRCKAEREAVDHLSRVAGIRRDHRRVLEAMGVTTLAALADLPLDPPPGGLRRTGFRRIREQARVQMEGRTRGGVPYHELRPEDDAEDGRALGFAALPEPSDYDLFFDIEGADYAYDEGLEYLFGVSRVDDTYEAEWALTPDEERAMLTRFLGRVTAHVAEHPGAHVYHFGHYETSTLKRLVGRYDVGTEELDALLKQEVFVDLHRVVKQAVVASVERYSIKTLEPFFGFERTVPLPEANQARGRLELALALGLLDQDALADRPAVQEYNKDDCVSTRALRHWLEKLRSQAIAEGREIPRPSTPEPRTSDEAEEVAGEIHDLMTELLEGVPEEDRDDDQKVRWLMAHLLEWHRREDKSAWWDYFRLRELSLDELIEETKPLAGLEYLGEVGTIARSTLHRFRFPPQEHRLSVGKAAKDAETEKGRTVHAIDERSRYVDLKVGNNTDWDPEGLHALLPDEIVGVKDQKKRLRTTAALLVEGEGQLRAWSPASLALLQRTPPHVNGAALTELSPDADLLTRARRATMGLEPGVLPVQGPPGTGKTYCGARMIRALIRAGKRVGVTGPSHKVITNLVTDICEADKDDEVTQIVGIQASPEDPCPDGRVLHVPSNGRLRSAVMAEADEGQPAFNLIAGTAWLWAHDDMEGAVDVLFIDEAGQFSLANALSVAPAAPRLVLLGDPQQLNQPQKGIHPPGTEVSVLVHLAGEDGIVTDERGLFLGETWRMRPEITAFTSELFYEGKLLPRPDLSEQHVRLADRTEFRGLTYVPSIHTGNSRSSEEEAAEVVGLFKRILGPRATFTNREGVTQPLALRDLLVVAPYNAQVDLITDRLADAGYEGACVGTVDKFQGQEAPVAIYSLASSSAEEAPRGMTFLYALDRLNVATSRARCATFVVASPALFTAECRGPEQMRMVNAFVRYGEMAGVQA